MQGFTYQQTENKESGQIYEPNSYSNEDDFVVNIVGGEVTMSVEMSTLLVTAQRVQL
jgi:hypothetical protein